MWYIILPRPELIYYVQHRLYAPIGAIDYINNIYIRHPTTIFRLFLQNVHQIISWQTHRDPHPNDLIL